LTLILLHGLNIDFRHWYDIVNETEWKSDKGKLTIELVPYDVIWIKPSHDSLLRHDTK
jgi:hypothetical protein